MIGCAEGREKPLPRRRPALALALALALAVLIVLTLATPLLAAEKKTNKRKEFDAIPITSRWRVWAGAGLNSATTDVGFTPTGLIGGLIRLEDDLGLDETVDAVALGASVRIGRHHRLQLAFTDLRRSSRQRLDKQFEFGK